MWVHNGEIKQAKRDLSDTKFDASFMQKIDLVILAQIFVAFC
jgi:hypothetical protein